MKENSRVEIIVLIIFVLMCSTFKVSSQKLYETTWKQSGVVIGGSTVMLGCAALIEHKRGTFTSSDIALLKRETIFGRDQGTIDNFSSQAGRISDHFKNGALVAPLALFLSGQARENAKEILVMYAEIISLNGGITSFTKGTFGKYRPYAYNPEVDIEIKLQSTTRRSFFSGHTSHVASLSFFTATVFDDLYPNSDFKYLIWAGAVVAPAITGYMRIKAGQHFSTDVIVGYGVGALVGYFIPELHKITQSTGVNIIGAEGGLGLVYNF
ncbi:MAG: membrane-associated phospholipid phosphatase [Saprospiraceae bacterium]|jgi:membrane-associated phospholipid phosphatase